MSPSEKSSLVDQKLAEYKSIALSSLSAARQHLQSSKEAPSSRSKDHHRRLEKRRSTEEARSSSSSSSSHHHKKESPREARRSSSHHVVKGETIPAPTPRTDPKPVRHNAIKNMVDALKRRVQQCADVSVEDAKLSDLVKEIEEQLFRLYSRDVGPKYKNKYRSLMFNIKDEKNSGLFRKIVEGKIAPKALVRMTPEEMASKELKQWRQAELKHDIEMIKSTELDQLARGNKFVVKSHKGEEIIGDQAKKGNVQEVKLPEESAVPEGNVKKKKEEEDNLDSWGPKTWEVSSYDPEEKLKLGLDVPKH